VKGNALTLATFVLALFVLMLYAGAVSAQTRVYHFGQEWAKIWINSDGSIDLFYNMSLTLDSGQDIHYVLIGQPKGDFTISQAADQYGNALSTSDASSASDYKVQVNLAQPLSAGQTVWFTLTTNVAHMIYEDNQTNVGMEFKPTWFSEASVLDLRVAIVMPVGVNASMVATAANYWNGTSVEPDGRLAIYWERQDLAPGQQYDFGVSFPSGFVPEFPSFLFLPLTIIATLVVVIVYRKKRVRLRPTDRPDLLSIDSRVRCLGNPRVLGCAQSLTSPFSILARFSEHSRLNLRNVQKCI
jgi:hypothetical protein